MKGHNRTPNDEIIRLCTIAIWFLSIMLVLMIAIPVIAAIWEITYD